MVTFVITFSFNFSCAIFAWDQLLFPVSPLGPSCRFDQLRPVSPLGPVAPVAPGRTSRTTTDYAQGVFVELPFEVIFRPSPCDPVSGCYWYLI